MVYLEEEVNPLLSSSGPRRRAPVPQVSSSTHRWYVFVMMNSSHYFRFLQSYGLVFVNIFFKSTIQFRIYIPAVTRSKTSRRKGTKGRLSSEFIRRARAMLVLDQNWTLQQFITKIRITTNPGTVHLVLAVKMVFGSTSEIKSGQSWGRWFGSSLSTAYWRFRCWPTIKSYLTAWQCSMLRFVLLHLLVTQKQHLRILGLYHKKQCRGRRWWEKASPHTQCAATAKRTNLRIRIIVESAIDVSVVWIITVHGWTIASELVISVSNLIWTSPLGAWISIGCLQ